MATGIYDTEPLQWLLEYRDDLLANIRKAVGGRIMSIAGGSKNHSKMLLTLDELKRELAEVRSSLHLLDPTTYPDPAADDGGILTVEFK